MIFKITTRQSDGMAGAPPFTLSADTTEQALDAAVMDALDTDSAVLPADIPVGMAISIERIA